MIGNVSGGCGMACGAGSRPSRFIFYIARSSVTGKRSFPSFANRQFTASPRSCCFDTLPRPMIVRCYGFKHREHLFGLDGGPLRDFLVRDSGGGYRVCVWRDGSVRPTKKRSVAGRPRVRT